MKKLILAAFAVLALADSAQAAQWKGFTPFSNLSTTGSTVYSAAYNVEGFRSKTLQVQGIAVSGHSAASLSGTVLMQCGPTSNGPWTTCLQTDRTAVSTTSNVILNWNDAAAYVRASWAKTAGEVSAWFTETEN